MREAPLHAASSWGNTEIVKLLVESDHCDLNITTRYGSTPLDCAAEHDDTTTVRVLVEAGARVPSNYSGTTATAEYLASEAPRIRFHSSARGESGRLHRVKGRGRRAATRDLADIAGFDRDMMGLLDQFCAGKR